DVVKAFDYLREHLGITQIKTLVGGSLGGQQALEWAIENPEVTRQLVLVASNAQQTPWGVAFNQTQRMAIEQDVTWQLNTDDAGLDGMRTARAIALLSYRNYQAYNTSQSERNHDRTDNFK